MSNDWFVYIIQCLDKSYYTGITNDLDERMKAHREGRGSKYVRSKGFSKLLVFKKFPSRSQALKFEYKIKQLPRGKKISAFSDQEAISL